MCYYCIKHYTDYTPTRNDRLLIDKLTQIQGNNFLSLAIKYISTEFKEEIYCRAR